MKKNLFTQVQVKKPPRSVFDLSHQFACTANYGNLYPCLVLDLVPGDKVNLSCDALIRAAPLVTPLMNRNDIFIHYWAVPFRLLWPGWEDYITQQPYDDTASIPAHPFIEIDDGDIDEEKSVFLSYFGLPAGIGVMGDLNDVKLSPFAFAAYQMIYNEWYRDQNLIDEVPYELIDGDNSAALATLLARRKRAWAHDYLTSALPFAQKGNAVSIPLGNVVLKSPWDVGIPHPRFVAADGDPDNGALAQAADLIDPTTSNITVAGNPKYAYNPDGTLTVAPTTINDLRRAYRLQEWYEKQARGGTRYIEVILSHFGIRSSDARLQRPEYITGAKSSLSISEVLQTSGTESTTPQGTMAGHGVAGVNGNYGKYYAEEHTMLIGILSIMPKAQYTNGIHKRYLKFNDPFEYYWPEFANIGEQAIQYQEVQVRTTNGKTATFGYIPRYAEYKYENNKMAGDFANTASPWVQARNLADEVVLDQEFIECNPDYNAFAVTAPTVDHFYINMWHNIRAVRPMPFYGTPSI